MALTSAASFSDYTESKILGWLSGASMPAASATIYAGLFTTNPADAGTGASPQDGTEMTTTNGTTGFAGYARIALTASSVWNAIAAATGDGTGQQLSNAAAIPASGTGWTNNGGSTVTVSGIGIWDAATAGNLLTYYPLATPQAVTNTTGFSMAASGLVTQVD
jgi:hypothetical protein